MNGCDFPDFGLEGRQNLQNKFYLDWVAVSIDSHGSDESGAVPVGLYAIV